MDEEGLNDTIEYKKMSEAYAKLRAQTISGIKKSNNFVQNVTTHAIHGKSSARGPLSRLLQEEEEED